jgi:leucyl-tRNA synthetase
VLHLLYARFWHKVLYDLGVVTTKEPFQKLYNQGMILSFAYQDQRGATIPADMAKEIGEEEYKHTQTDEPLTRVVAKMSKTLHNVVNPDAVVKEHGADTLRLYEMYMGPLADSKPWNTKDVPGVRRFLGRVWRLIVPQEDGDTPVHAWLAEDRDPDPALETALHRCIHKVGGDIEKLAFNTAIAAMMIFTNEATKRPDALNRSQALRFVQVLNPFAPHITEELWSRLKGKGSLAYVPWPGVDESLLTDETVEMVVQVNGKVRARIIVGADADDASVLAAARDAIQDQIAGKKIVKEIVVKGRLVNLVVK